MKNEIRDECFKAIELLAKQRLLTKSQVVKLGIKMIKLTDIRWESIK